MAMNRQAQEDHTPGAVPRKISILSPRHSPRAGSASARAAAPYSAACLSAGAAALTSASTCTSNLAKFLVNMSTSARAC